MHAFYSSDALFIDENKLRKEVKFSEWGCSDFTTKKLVASDTTKSHDKHDY